LEVKIIFQIKFNRDHSPSAMYVVFIISSPLLYM